MRNLLIITFGFLTTFIFAQEQLIFVELGGNGGAASLNYEWQFTNKPKLSLRLGIGITAFEFEEDQPAVSVSGCVICGIDLNFPKFSVSLPISFQYFFDLQNNNYIETGLGSTLQQTERLILVYHANLGFRRNFGKNKNWMWSIKITPLIGVSGKDVFKESEPTFWGGIGIGKRF